MRRAQLGVCVRQPDAAAGEERFQRSDVITRFTSDFSEDGERLAVSLADVLSRDSATRSRQRRRDRRSRTLTWPEFEVPVATRRIAASVQESVGPFWTPEPSGKPCGVYRERSVAGPPQSAGQWKHHLGPAVCGGFSGLRTGLP
jgi:hypothetical protein